MIQQLTFWNETPQEKIEKRMTALEERVNKTIRSQYAKIGQLTKQCLDYENELEILKSALVRCGLRVTVRGDTSFYMIESKNEISI